MENKENLKKRVSRSQNWTAAMKEAFRSFVEEFAEIINSKANDTKSISLKQQAWKKIGQNMASIGYSVDEKRMRETWTRFKLKARSSVSEYKRATLATVGSPAPNVPDAFDYQVIEMDPIDAEEDYASFDWDAEETIAPFEYLSRNQKRDGEEVCDTYETSQNASVANVLQETVIVQEDIEESGNKCSQKKNAKTGKSSADKPARFHRNEQIMLSKRIKQIEDEHEEMKKLKGLQLQIEMKKMESLIEDQEWKRKIFAAKLAAQESKRNYYERKLSLFN